MQKTEEAKEFTAEYTGKAKDELEDLQKRAEFTKKKISELISAVREFEAEDEEVASVLAEGKEVVKKLTSAKKSTKK